MSQRIAWIDCWKGIAIIAVVVSHVVENSVSKYIFWFHMPLFFFISGYLYKSKFDYFAFFQKKFFHLLIPYLSFLILLSSHIYASYVLDMWQQRRSDLISEVLQTTFNLVYGGTKLTGSLGIFWFVTCLFLTQQLYNFLYSKFGSNNWLMLKIMLVSYCLAMMNFWLIQNVSYPWSIDAVAMTLPFYWIGHMAANSSINNTKAVSLSVIIFVTAVIIDNWTFFDLTFNIKYRMYGVIIVNILIALAGIIMTWKLAENLYKIDLIGNVTSEIGKASMVIMYLHQIIQLNMNKHPMLHNEIIRVLAGLLIPYVTYVMIKNYSIMRNYFLGEFASSSVVKSQDK